jgi:XRE family transcriptional regulator, fatty acid utilization regulator
MTNPLVTTDQLTIGRRVRHLRRQAKLTLDDLSAQVGVSPSALSLIENGKREAKLSLLTQIAQALGVGVPEVLSSAPPSRRAALEIELERAQRDAAFPSLGLPTVTITSRLPTEAIEALVGLHRALAEAHTERAATPEHARRANASLRERMRAQDNYFGDIETLASGLMGDIGHQQGPMTQTQVDRLVAHLGYELVHTRNLPKSTRTVTDLAHRRIYLPETDEALSDAKTLALQAIGHLVLGHEVPGDYADFLEQRVEVNYFAASCLMPERTAVTLLQRAKAAKDIAIEDLRDAYAVSYEMAAHRFTNLATRHLDLPVHFMRISSQGIIYKAYENDGVHFPSDPTGAIEGQRVCKQWTARMVFEQSDRSVAYRQYTDTGRGTYWCTAAVDRTPAGEFSVSIGVPFAHVKWMRGRETLLRSKSLCPDPVCCDRPPAELAERWEGKVWPSARVQSHLLAAMPPGVFPGVDETAVMRFLENQAQTAR